jgi:hypothetical protein
VVKSTDDRTASSSGSNTKSTTTTTAKQSNNDDIELRILELQRLVSAHSNALANRNNSSTTVTTIINTANTANSNTNANNNPNLDIDWKLVIDKTGIATELDRIRANMRAKDDESVALRNQLHVSLRTVPSVC